MERTQSRTSRAYCRVEMCSGSWNRPGQRCSCPVILGSSNHSRSDFLVPSVNSNRTGFCVLLCRIDVRSLIWPAAYTSATFRRTRSQPLSLLSMAVLNRARPRRFSAISRRTRIAQTCFGRSGRFWPTMRPLFQAGRCRRMAGRLMICMTDPPIHLAHPHRRPNVGHASYPQGAALRQVTSSSPEQALRKSLKNDPSAQQRPVVVGFSN